MIMKNTLFLLFFSSIFVFSHFGKLQAAQSNDGKVYIVYMGSAASPANKNNHDTLLSSLLKRKKNAVVQTYKHGFRGFAARLSDSEAREVAKKPGVVSIFEDPILQLHTTRSWDFLQYETALLIDSHTHSSPADLPSRGSDTIIGILDTGIWPESESFNDRGMGPVPSRWKGTCMGGQDFNSSTCNRKLIGARYYEDHDAETTFRTARDALGHGTHVSSTAAGAAVINASYYGLATGTAKGGSPTSRIAMYRVCSPFGCRGSAILAAFDDAISDGVDLLSLSLGSSAGFGPDFSTDPIAIGSFHAVHKGITVVCSAGNDGPNLQTVVNVAPWILTVAASTIDRDLQSNIVLGNNKVIKGESINFSDLQKSPVHPLIDGASAKTSSATEDEARKCYPDAIDEEKIKDKIVVCQHSDSQFSMRKQIAGVKGLGGVGAVFVSDKTRLVASNSGSFPMTVITTKDSEEILAYINSTRKSVATILPTETVPDYKPAPTVAYFSARGPSYATKNLLKPDIAAPGVNILAAWIGNDTTEETTPTGKEPPYFNLLSGTSMACPHVAGIAANIKSQNPTWSPAAIRSGIMTTAIQTNNMKEMITTHSSEVATPYDYGAGEISPTAGFQPGLVYENEPVDYLQFLCYCGYNVTTIKLISADLPDGFSCPKNSSSDMISNINYPSIAVSKNVAENPVTVTRTVTNVDGTDEETTYTAIVDAPKGLEVKVVPNSLKFAASTKKLSYQITFSSSSTVKGDLFGSITWTNKKHNVRSPFVVSNTE